MKDDQTIPEPEGWSCVIGSPKYHYMVGKRSVCGQWLLLFASGEDYEPDVGNNPNDCKACRKWLDKEHPS